MNGTIIRRELNSLRPYIASKFRFFWATCSLSSWHFLRLDLRDEGDIDTGCELAGELGAGCVSTFFAEHFPWSVSGNPWLDSKNISSYDGDVNESEWSIIYVYCGSMLYIISAIRITGIGLSFYQLKKRMINLHLLIVLSLKTIVSKNLSCLTWNWVDTSHVYRLRTSDIFLIWRGDIPSYKPK